MNQFNKNLNQENFDNFRKNTCKNYINILGICFFGLLISIIISLQKKIFDLKNKYNELDDIFHELYNKNKELILSDSKIINKNIKYLLFLKTWINPNKKLFSKLIYRLSEDGESIKIFHKKCDNKTQTLILIESLNGELFGGYITCTWDGNMIDKNDNKTFLFNLNKNVKFEKRYNVFNNRDIYAYNNIGPYFGLRDLFFYPSMKFCNSFQSAQFSFLNDINDLTNHKNEIFEIKEVEIYKINFE